MAEDRRGQATAAGVSPCWARLALAAALTHAPAWAEPVPTPNAAPSAAPDPHRNPPRESPAPGLGPSSSVTLAPATAGSAATEPTPPAEPTPPTPGDPMLEPLPPAEQVLHSWRQALRLVRARSTSLAQAKAQVESAAAQSRLTLAGLYPRINATGNVRRDLLFNSSSNLPVGLAQTFGIGASTIWSAGLDVRQPVIAPKTWYDHETARLSQSAAALRAEDAERIVLAAVADTIVASVTAERLAEISRVSLQSSLATLDLTRRRARLGAGNAVDVLRSEQEVALNRAQVVSANETVRRAREALGMALGYASPWGITPDVKLDDLARDARAVCAPIMDIEQRADLRAQRTAVKVARRSQDSNDWLLSPTLDAYTQLNYSDAPFTANGRPAQWLIGATLTVPLYDGGARHAQSQLGAAQVQTAAAQLTQAQREAQMEVRQARRAVEVAEKNFAVSRRSREISSETSRLARLSFVNGRATSFELVDADRRLRQAELDLAVKEFELVRARILALLAQANCDL